MSDSMTAVQPARDKRSFYVFMAATSLVVAFVGFAQGLIEAGEVGMRIGRDGVLGTLAPGDATTVSDGL